MTQWVEEWVRLEATSPVTHGPGYAHGQMVNAFSALSADERAIAIEALAQAAGGEDANLRASAMWFARRLDLIELLPAGRELAARLGQAGGPASQDE